MVAGNVSITLIGPGGAGRTTVGALIAKRLGIPLVDLDRRFAGHLRGSPRPQDRDDARTDVPRRRSSGCHPAGCLQSAAVQQSTVDERVASNRAFLTVLMRGEDDLHVHHG